MAGYPGVFAFFVPILTLIISLAVGVYVLILLTRLVRAVEKIADQSK